MSSKQVSFYFAGTASAMLLCAFVTVSNGQSPDQRMDRITHTGQHVMKASDLIGLSVRTSGDEEKGKIKDLMIGPDGRVEYAAVSFGGFLGIGDKLFAVPLDALQIEWKDNKLDHVQCDITEETIKQRQ